MANDIHRDLGKLKDDVEKLRTHTADLVSKVAGASKDAVESAVDVSKAATNKAAKTIKSNPIMTLAGAVGVGVMLGGIAKKLFGRKK